MLLPPTRTWPDEVEKLAEALLDGADGRREVEAGLSLLFYEGRLFHRADIRTRYMVEHGPKTADVNWQMLFEERYSLPLSREERGLLALACSMGDHAVRINLPTELASLGTANTRHFLDVIRHMAGR